MEQIGYYVFHVLCMMVKVRWDKVIMIELYLCLVTEVVCQAQPSYFVSKRIIGKSTVVTTEVGFKLSKYYDRRR